MSGFVVIVQPDGTVLDRTLMDRLTESMSFRGPDGRRVEVVDNAGLGYAMLRTGFGSEGDGQPRTLDGDAWICADARIDDREALRGSLDDRGLKDIDEASDAELILHAYQVWGLESPEHLLGDFSFAIWDRRRRRLFCARDHFGVKPFFYARVGGAIVAGNTLDTVRSHPQVSDRLDDLAIADYLLFSYHQDPEATDFADVRRLPAAHALVWDGGTLSIRRYWSLATEETLRYRDGREYVDQFNEVFGRAVGDRLRSPRVAIRMSGGLDSTAVAATAVRVSASGTRACRLKVFTGVFERLISDEEGSWAETVADHLGIPIQLVAFDGPETLVEGSAPPQQASADPLSRAVADFGRVALTGFGGDPINRGTSSYYLDTLKSGRLGWLVGDVRRALREGKKPPLLLRTMWRHWRSRRRLRASYPSWINRELEERLALRSRWLDVCAEESIGWSARAELSAPYWPFMLSGQDPGETGLPVDHRHPFFDLRVVRYMLRVPTVPWCLQKLLVRKAMAGKLPAEVVARPKGTLATDPTDVFLAHESREWWRARLEGVPAIERFIDSGAYLTAVDTHFGTGEHDIDWLLRPVYLANWLRHRELA